MKRLLLITLLIVTVFKLTAQEQKQYFDNGNLKSSGQINKNGNRTGEWNIYYENGQLKLVGKHLDGKLVGEWKSYYDNGQLNSILKFVDGKAVGESKYYHENGDLKGIGNYQNGEQVGEWKYYHENGDLQGIGNYQNGEQVGKLTYHYKNGQLNSIFNYNQGMDTVEIRSYHENGQLFGIGKYVDNKKTAQWKYYHENGQLQSVGTYLNDEFDGEWKNYHENGAISIIRLWEIGKYMEIISCYDNKGNALEKGTLINGSGTVKNYDVHGYFTETATYLNGVKQENDEFELISFHKWYVEYVETAGQKKETNPEVAKNNWFFFRNDGKLEGLEEGDKYVIKWDYDQSQKTIRTDDGEGTKNDFKLISVTENKLVLSIKVEGVESIIAMKK